MRFQSGEFAIGKSALESIVTDADDIVDRFVGRLGQDDSSTILDGKEFPPEVLTAVLARQIADNAQQDVGYFNPVTYTPRRVLPDKRTAIYTVRIHGLAAHSRRREVPALVGLLEIWTVTVSPWACSSGIDAVRGLRRASPTVSHGFGRRPATPEALAGVEK